MEFRVGSAPARSVGFSHGNTAVFDAGSEPPLVSVCVRACVRACVRVCLFVCQEVALLYNEETHSSSPLMCIVQVHLLLTSHKVLQLNSRMYISMCMHVHQLFHEI